MNLHELSAFLLILASLFSIINLRILKLPHTIGLMVLAIVLSLVVLLTGLIMPDFLSMATSLTEQFDFSVLLIDVMLPFLLFAGAISVDVHELLKDKVTILLLASFGVIFSTFAVGTGLFWIVSQPFLGLTGVGLTYVDCLLFGALGVVVFLTLLTMKVEGVENITAASVSMLFATEVIGGVLLGAGLGFLGLKLVEYIENEHVELEVLITLSLVLLVPVIAHVFHFSAVLAVVVMGLFLNQNIDTDKKTDGVQKAMGDYVYKFWHLVDETLNAILFILIGLEIIPILQNFEMSYIVLIVLVVILVVVSRGIGVILPIQLLSIKQVFEKNTALIITWGGLRGGLSIALALNLPDSIGTGKDLILILTYGVVLFTILVQGLTLKKIVK